MNGEYVADFGVNGSVRMFAASGEVKDQAVIQKYISGRQLTSRYSQQQQVEVDESEFSLTISGDKFTIKRPGLNDGEQSCRITGVNRYVVTWKGTLRVIISSEVTASSKCADLTKNLLQYPVQQLDYKDIPGTSGFRASYIPGIEHVIYIKPGAISLPVLIYSASHDEATQSCMFSEGSYNLLNEAGLTGLQTGDTIVFQQRTLHLKKK